MGSVQAGETAVYEAIGGALSPHYEIRSTDLREAARKACDAFMASMTPPLRPVGRMESGELLTAGPPSDAEVYSRHVRAWVMRQLLAEREWLHGTLEGLQPGWTLCLHRRSRLGNEEWPAGGMHVGFHFEVSAHILTFGAVCDILPHEQYGPKPAL